MAANKFATMLSRKTNKITLVLVYAVLEWTLICLLILHSLFSFLIIKFANYFGLKKPCLLCSRLDHVFEPKTPNSSYADLLCEQHATEISKLGYCSNHRKLVECQNMCEDCLSSTHHNHHENASMNAVRCSCCDVIITHKILSPDILIKPSLGLLDDAQKANFVTESRVDGDIERRNLVINEREQNGHDYEHGVVLLGGSIEPKREVNSDGFCFYRSKFDGYQILEGDEAEREDVLETEIEPLLQEQTTEVSGKDPSSDETVNQVLEGEVPTTDILPQHLEFYIDCDDYRLIPVELVDSVATEVKAENPVRVEEVQRNLGKEEPISSPEICRETKVDLVLLSDSEIAITREIEEETSSELLDSVKIVKSLSNSEGQQEDVAEEVGGQVAESQTAEHIPSKADNAQQAAEATAVNATDSASEDPCHARSDETEEENGGFEPVHQVRVEEPSTPCKEEVASTIDLVCEVSVTFTNVLTNDDHDSKLIEEETEKGKDLSVEISERSIKHNSLALPPELNEGEEEKAPETPTSLESLHHLHKKLLLLGKKESGAEESLDGSIISESEGGDGVQSIEQLKSAFRAERKALHALYAELEEERNAAAVAANQTMAMINRLQDEKATMQMEALHYQRMMEEQAEYDQEALQMLNEVIVKRETEKQELEKELEMYRKKVMDYEEKERLRKLGSRKDSSTRSRASSASCSNGEESDGLSIDLNSELKEEDVSCNHEANGYHDDTPVDAILNLQESMASFEGERMSILQELKALEEKLFTLSTEEEEHFENMKPFEKFYEENGKDFHRSFTANTQTNSVENGFSSTNDKHHQEKGLNGSMPKQLLPLFDAAESEFEDGELNRYEPVSDSIILSKSPSTKYELEKRRLAIEDEVDQVYERLQALEADREFLKNCILSLRKGDKGIDLLHEILQHLRDLKNVELQARNLSDATSYKVSL
ncbi:hypothetical protein Ancab_018415 [Ancistrocladus abbreviatus]